MSQLQTEFLERKSNEKISLRSLQQLQTRTAALIQAVGGGFFVQSLKFRHVDLFVQDLAASKDLKTVREYKSACAQMLSFAVQMKYAAKNPFDQIKIKHAQPTPRQRWERHSYHPVRHWLEHGAPWDGIPRVDAVIATLNAANPAYASAVLYAWLVGCAAALYQPRWHSKLVPVLAGGSPIEKVRG